MKKVTILVAILVLFCLFFTATAEESIHDLSSIAIGDVIVFGHYEQDNNLTNGPEGIEWIVLDVQAGKALLLSKYGLDAKPYHTEFVAITWADCALRTWLNNDFLNGAFSETEQSAILLADVDNSDAQGNPKYYSAGISNTQDTIFLLSYHEAYDIYFPNNENRMCIATKYARANGAWTKYVENNAAGPWWLRSPGMFQDNASNVYYDGTRANTRVDRDDFIVRPAIWLSLEPRI